jgi:hypothetical protein
VNLYMAILIFAVSSERLRRLVAFPTNMGFLRPILTRILTEVGHGLELLNEFHEKHTDHGG